MSGRNQELKFEIINQIGVISTSASGWNVELNRVSWNGNEPNLLSTKYVQNVESTIRPIFLNAGIARYMFDEEIKSNVRITLNDIDAENMPYALSCEYEVI